MTTDIASLVSGNLEVWTGVVERKSGAGRGNGKRVSLYGIERLRALILELAVCGKLLPQDQNDEPAATLLKRVAEQRATLVKSGKIGKPRNFAPVSPEPPYAIPAGWEWVQIAAIGHDWGQKKPDSDFSYIDVGSIDQALGRIREPSVVGAASAPSRARKIVRHGTVIYSTVRPYLLNIAIVDQEFEPEPIASTAFAVVHPFQGIEARYVYRYLRSPAFVRYVEACQTGIAYPAINDRQFFSAWFPLPPTAEQQRIVAKVDELMALCDVLEKESTAAIAAHQTLVEALLAALTASIDTAELAANWQRLETNFDILFSTEASVDALRQTVLELAVRGKLVPQAPEDAPVKVSTKEEHFRAEPLFDIPSSWQCLPLDALGRQIGGGTPSKGRAEYWEGSTPWVSPKDMKQDYVTDTQLHISEEAIEGSAVKRIPPDSLLFVVRGMILAHSFPVAIAKVPVTINQDMKAIELHDPRIVEYLLRALKALKPLVLKRVERSSHGTCRLDAEAYGSLPIPLPPLAEQQRIVAKVDELLVLCDALKSRIADAAVTQTNFADAIVERAAA